MIKGWTVYDAHEKYPQTFGNNDLNIGFSDKDIDCYADFTITFDGIAPQLHIFDDCWMALYKYGQEFLELLSTMNAQNITKKEFKAKLIELGFESE